MSEPVYTVVAVTARFVIVADQPGRRDKILISKPSPVAKGGTMTQTEIDALK